MPWKKHSDRRPLTAALLAVLILGFGTVAHAVTVKSDGAEVTECSGELLLTVSINGLYSPHCEHIATLTQGGLAAQSEAFQRWRIPLPDMEPIRHEGREYYPLAAVPGLSFYIDQEKQQLILEAPPKVFFPTRLTERRGFIASTPPPDPGAFFNYDFSADHTQGSRTNHSGLLELGAFNRFGVGTATMLWRDTEEVNNLIRLDTTWTRDDPEDMTRLRLGDTIGRAGSWGRAVRFGGIQWGSSFDTQPGFITIPLPSASGEAALPSTVDVFVNNARRLSRDIPAGPFEIENVPVVTGQGDVQLVVTDLLGRQQIITQSYYASSNLLRAGLSDYSFEAGFIRNNYGIDSDDYGRLVTSATHRYGVTDYFTRELRAELLSDQQTAGISAVYLWPSLGTANASFALSHGPKGDGELLSFGFQRQARRMSFTAQSRYNSRDFAQIGLTPGPSNPKLSHSASIGYSTPGYGAISLSYLNQSYWGQQDNEIFSANYSVNLGGDYFFTLQALESRSENTNRSLGLSITRAFGANTTANLRHTHQTAGDSSAVQIQRNLPVGPGFGYNLLSEEGINRRHEARGYWQTDIGTYSAEASKTSNASTYRFGARGGLATMGGGVFASRTISDSFAVVKTGDYPDITIYAENHPVAKTDSSGMAMVPRLRAYDRNSISIDVGELPLDAEIDTLRQEAIPYLRSGIFVDFPVKPSRGATIRITLEDGSPMPSGAIIRIAGLEEEFPVAMRGETFLTGLQENNELIASWNGLECQISLNIPADAGPLPDLGSFVCKGVKP